MAKKDVMIKDAPLVETLSGEEKIPISDGSGEPKSTDINGIKDFIGDSYELVELSEEVGKKQDKPFVIDIDKLGEPIEEEDYAMAFTRTQVESALGMTIAEILDILEQKELEVTMDGVNFGNSSYCYIEGSKEEGTRARIYYYIAVPDVAYIATVFEDRTDDIALMFHAYDSGYEVREAIAELKSKDTQHDAQLTELSEKIENLPSGESSVFVAIYGETTYEEIKAANDEGKIVVARYENNIYRLSVVKSYEAILYASEGNNSYTLKCSNKSVWSGAAIANTHSLKTLDNGNAQITIAGKTAEVATPQYVENAIQQSGGGASTDKQGVVSQTLNYNSADNTYSVSNVVRGSIPSFFIDLVTEAGASFNAESGYFSLNGIDNIAYDEMRQIYDCRTGYGTNSLLAVYGDAYTARTNFAAFRDFAVSYSNHQPTTIYMKYFCYRNASITKFVIHNEGIPLYVRADSVNNFEAFRSGDPMVSSKIEEIVGIIDVTNLTSSANFFYNGAHHPWLTSFQLKSLKASIDLSGMPRLSEATILYMINNEKAASAITIKLHADAKAMADASEAIQSALANHANITLGV